MAEAPYPSDTRAKGWRFELDHERIRQSDTWALCPAEHRPWLLMIWMVAWEQTPCGSMPDDDALICARTGMSAKAFAKAKASLMRGWWKADDGRLYHKVITERVLDMLERRRKEAERKRGSRGVKPEGVGSPTDVPRDTIGTDDTGTSTGTIKKKEDSASALLAAEGIPEDLSRDFLAIRKVQKAPFTQTALSGFVREAAKAGITLEEAIRVSTERSWRGFKADWLADGKQSVAVGRHTDTAEETKRMLDERNLKAAKPAPEIQARIDGILKGKVYQ